MNASLSAFDFTSSEENLGQSTASGEDIRLGTWRTQKDLKLAAGVSL